MACLDTSFIIDFLHGNKDALSLLEEINLLEQRLTLPSPVIMEIWFGVCLQERESKEKQKVLALLGSMEILSFDERCAKETAEIRAQLQKKGKPIVIEDCMIAAIAKIHNETLVTKDADFSSIEGL